MFFPYIFVNIDHREMIIENNIVRLDLIHKFNSIHFLSKLRSFRVFGWQMCEIANITLFKRTTRKVNVNIGVRIRRFFLLNLITHQKCSPYAEKSEPRKKSENRKYSFSWVTNLFWKIPNFPFWRWVGGLQVVGRWVGVVISGGWVGLVRWAVGWAWSNRGDRWDGV